MSNIRNIRNIRTFTKSVNNALMLVRHQLRSSHHENDNMMETDMANVANARRFIDNYMRRFETRSSERKEMVQKKDCGAGNVVKCEITRKNKREGDVDCNCEFVCMAKVSETMMIHKEGKREE